MKKKKSIDEEQEIKILTKRLNVLVKEHNKMKHLVSEAQHDLALIKAITKHEKKTRKRPQEVYMQNVKKRVNGAIETLTKVYDRKKKRKIVVVDDTELSNTITNSALNDLSEVDTH